MNTKGESIPCLLFKGKYLTQDFGLEIGDTVNVTYNIEHQTILITKQLPEKLKVHIDEAKPPGLKGQASLF